jgi:hypothetical protein
MRSFDQFLAVLDEIPVARRAEGKRCASHTIASQTAALIGFARSRGYQVPTEWIFEARPASRSRVGERTTVWAILRNPAYKGTACFGKTETTTRQRIPVSEIRP